MINKKILFLHGSNDLYGSSKILINIINLLFDEGYEIHLVTPYEGPLNQILKNKTTIYNKNLGVFRKKYFNFFGILNRCTKVFSSFLFLNRIIKNHDIQLVYTNTSVIIVGGIVAKFNSIKSYFHIHEIPTNKFYLSIIRNLISLVSTKIIVVSDSVKTHWDFKASVEVRLIYNGFNLKFNSNLNNEIKNQIVFTSIGRLIPYKGHLYLLKIAKKLIEINDKIVFFIVGDTFNGYEEYELSLHKYVKQNFLEKNIIFTGFKKDVSIYYKKTDFFIHTAINPDPLPTVILESISHDIPVISTNLGGAVEILDYGKGGLLIPKNNINKSVKMILNYMVNNDDILNKKKNAKEHFKRNFSNIKFKNNILSLFE